MKGDRVKPLQVATTPAGLSVHAHARDGSFLDVFGTTFY